MSGPSHDATRLTIIIEGPGAVDERLDFPPSSKLTPKILNAITTVLKQEAEAQQAELCIFLRAVKRGEITLWPPA